MARDKWEDTAYKAALAAGAVGAVKYIGKTLAPVAKKVVKKVGKMLKPKGQRKKYFNNTYEEGK